MRSFYGEVLGLPVAFEDEVSAVFDFGGTSINVLAVEAAPELVTPARRAVRDLSAAEALAATRSVPGL